MVIIITIFVNYWCIFVHKNDKKTKQTIVFVVIIFIIGGFSIAVALSQAMPMVLNKLMPLKRISSNGRRGAIFVIF